MERTREINDQIWQMLKIVESKSKLRPGLKGDQRIFVSLKSIEFVVLELLIRTTSLARENSLHFFLLLIASMISQSYRLLHVSSRFLVYITTKAKANDLLYCSLRPG